jgi:hypothetical protein
VASCQSFFVLIIFMFVSSLLFAVKHDCVFGNDLDVDEITFVSEVYSTFWCINFMSSIFSE